VRIGLLTSSYPTSPRETVNAGVFARDLALELAALSHAIHVITPLKPVPIHVDPSLRLCEIRWPARERDLASVSMRNPIAALRYGMLIANGLWLVPEYVRKERLDALLALWAIPSGLFAWQAWRRSDIPYGVWALGSDIWSRRKYPFGDAVVRRVVRDAAFCFADGVQLARDAAALSNRECEFLPSARRLEGTPSPPVALAADAPHFLFIGRYERNKGPDVLVEAMRLLLDGGADIYLHLFGVGSLRELLRQRIAGYEQRILLGDYADPTCATAYMQACDWLVIPSRVESIPLVFVDALQMRLPIVSTAVGDLGGLVEKYGVGFAVEPENPVALAAAMREALGHTRDEYLPALSRAAADFDLAASAARVADALALAAKARQ
jgi:glycosyltransferase involved in cell wall biosynthesis